MNVVYFTVAVFAGVLAFTTLCLVECLLDDGQERSTDSTASLLWTGLAACFVTVAATLYLLGSM